MKHSAIKLLKNVAKKHIGLFSGEKVGGKGVEEAVDCGMRQPS